MKYVAIPEFNQFVEYVTQGDLVDGEYQVVVNRVEITEQPIIEAAETLKAAYEHVSTLDRLPEPLTEENLTVVKDKVTDAYCEDVAAYVTQTNEVIPLLTNVVEVKSYPDWKVGEAVQAGWVRHYRINGNLYKVIQAHTTQTDWTPDITPALWLKFHDPSSGTYPAWVQPTGAHDAYNIGDKVTFNGHLWESKINANVWSPIVYPAGWKDLGVYP